MKNMVWQWVVGSLVVVSAAGCAASEAGDVAGPEEVGPPSASQQVGVVYSSFGGGPNALDYEVRVELGEPLEPGMSGCDLATFEGTVIVPFTMTLVHTHETAHAALTGEETGPDGDPVRVYTPRSMKVEAVGEAGPVRWAPKSGTTCTDQPDLESYVSLAWQPGEQAVMPGYLAGVPEADPTGSGLVIEMTRDSWEIHQGEPEPLTVTY
jgi:hypothetical protein